jgi:hypothetical protein
MEYNSVYLLDTKSTTVFSGSQTVSTDDKGLKTIAIDATVSRKTNGRFMSPDDMVYNVIT